MALKCLVSGVTHIYSAINFLMNKILIFSLSFLHIWSLPHFQRIYCSFMIGLFPAFWWRGSSIYFGFSLCTSGSARYKRDTELNTDIRNGQIFIFHTWMLVLNNIRGADSFCSISAKYSIHKMCSHFFRIEFWFVLKLCPVSKAFTINNRNKIRILNFNWSYFNSWSIIIL
jgi:hypothetical protein